jgi:hypothetical protein
MLHTNNKQVMLQMKEHVLDNFKQENYGGCPVAMQNVVNQIEYMQNPGETVYQTAERYVEGGSLLVYYYDQRKFLQELLQQTDEQSSKYSDDKVWKLYIHLCARAINGLYYDRKRELELLWK